jgi:hypothetical protein
VPIELSAAALLIVVLSGLLVIRAMQSSREPAPVGGPGTSISDDGTPLRSPPPAAVAPRRTVMAQQPLGFGQTVTAVALGIWTFVLSAALIGGVVLAIVLLSLDATPRP